MFCFQIDLKAFPNISHVPTGLYLVDLGKVVKDNTFIYDILK